MCLTKIPVYEIIQSIAGLAIAGTFFLQYRLNKMQATQLRMSSLPVINLEYEPDEPFFDPEKRDAGKLIIRVKKNVAYELWFEFVDRKDMVFDLNGSSSVMENDSYIKIFSYDKGELSYFIVRANFLDIAGNKYTQDFRYWENRFLPSAPKLA